MILPEEKRKFKPETNYNAPRKERLIIKKHEKHNQKFRHLHATYDVIELTDISELEESMMRYQPDLILYEASPKSNFIETEAYQTLNRNSRILQIPILLIAREYSIDSYKLCMKIGADAYLKDNYQWDLLPILIENLIQSRKKLLKEDNEKLNASHHFEDTSFILKINQLISENLDDPEFNVASLCDALAMSRSMVYKKLKTLKGQSVIEYIRTRKIDESVRLLKSKKYKIFEVAFMVGFSSQKYFRKIFVQRFGIPPSKFI